MISRLLSLLPKSGMMMITARNDLCLVEIIIRMAEMLCVFFGAERTVDNSMLVVS